LSTDHYELRIVNVDGSGRRTVPIAKQPQDYYTPIDWSPDGKTILALGYIRQPYWNGYVAVDAAGGTARRLKRIYSEYGDMAGYSRDGRWIVGAMRLEQDKPDWDIFALESDTGREAMVVSGPGADRYPVWVPDSDILVFRSDRGGKNGVWMVRFQNGRAAGEPVLVRADAGDYQPLGISRDGSLFYKVSHSTNDIYQVGVDPVTLKAQGTPVRIVENYRGENYTPSWSPAGESFAYYSNRDQVSRMVIRQLDGKEIQIAEPVRTTGHAPQWCNGGNGVLSAHPVRSRVFDVRTGVGNELLDASGGHSTPHDDCDAVFSSDCKSAYYSMYASNPNRRTIFRYDLASGRKTDLYADAGEQADGPLLSPDGKWLALHGKLEGGKDQGILMLSLGERKLRMLDAAGLWGYAWSADSRRLLYAREVHTSNSEDDMRELVWASPEGGEPQTIMRMAHAEDPSLSPDGARLLFDAGTTTVELWALRNLPLNNGPAGNANANEPRLVSQGPVQNYWGRIMPNGKQLYVVDGSGNVGLRDLGTGKLRYLTNDGKDWVRGAAGWALSRDGKQIAFASLLSDRKVTVRVVNIDGTGLRSLPVKPAETYMVLDWSPDGKKLLAGFAEGNMIWPDIVTIDVTSGEIHRLIPASATSPTNQPGGGFAGFSSDGKWIVYSRPVKASGWPSAIYALNVQTGAENTLVEAANSSFRQPEWVPGTDLIAYLASRDGRDGIWTIRFQAGWPVGSPVLVKHDLGAGNPKSEGISRDGTFFYRMPSRKSDVYQAVLDPQTLRLQGTPQLAVKTYAGKNAYPAWAPDGNSFVYESRRDESEQYLRQVVFRQADGKEIVSTQGASEQIPQWCVEGKQAFVPWAGLFDALTGAYTQMSAIGRWPMAVTPDCRTAFFYSSEEQGHRGIFRVDIGTQKEILLHGEPAAGNLSVSPDGRWLAYEGKPPLSRWPALVLLPATGGEPRVLDETPGVATWTGISWTPDSKRILFPRYIWEGENEIYWISIDGGPAQFTGLRMHAATAPSMNRDGRRILFSALEDKSEIWALPLLAQH
jgi:Tol biopolymer transport system component